MNIIHKSFIVTSSKFIHSGRVHFYTGQGAVHFKGDGMNMYDGPVFFGELIFCESRLVNFKIVR